MWEKITIPMYRSWFHGLYRLHGPCCPQKPLYSLQEPKAAVHRKFFVIMFRHVFLLYEIMQVFPVYLLISLPLTEMYMAMKLPLHVHYDSMCKHLALICLCSRWLVSDLWPSQVTPSPEWNMLCTDLIEYKPNVFKRKKHLFISALSSKSSRYYV